MSENLSNSEGETQNADQTLQLLIEKCENGEITTEVLKGMLKCSSAAEEIAGSIPSMKGMPLSMLPKDGGLYKNIVRLLLRINAVGFDDLVLKASNIKSNGSLKEQLDDASHSTIDRTLQAKLRAQVAFLAGANDENEESKEKKAINKTVDLNTTLDKTLSIAGLKKHELRAAMMSQGADEFYVNLFLGKVSKNPLSYIKREFVDNFSSLEDALKVFGVEIVES